MAVVANKIAQVDAVAATVAEEALPSTSQTTSVHAVESSDKYEAKRGRQESALFSFTLLSWNRKEM